jgi:hypothetical protein
MIGVGAAFWRMVSACKSPLQGPQRHCAPQLAPQVSVTQVLAHTSTSDTANEATDNNNNLSGTKGFTASVPLTVSVGPLVPVVPPVVPVSLTVSEVPVAPPAQKVDRF